MKTFVYIDHFKGEVQPASWEALGLAKSFGTAVALVFGIGVDEVAKAAVEYGADEVLVADDSTLTDYRAETYASTLSALASSQSPNLILFPTTARTREMAAMSAVDLNTGVLTDVSALEVNGDASSSLSIVATRPIYEGKVLEKTVCSGKPIMATIRGRAFPKPEREEGKSGTITKVAAAGEAKSTVEGYSASESAVNLGDAPVIVSGGRGVSNNPNITPPDGMDEKQAEVWRAQQGFALVTELAQLLGAAAKSSISSFMKKPTFFR
jgi:electron transfer flavoprotein alpha subunit